MTTSGESVERARRGSAPRVGPAVHGRDSLTRILESSLDDEARFERAVRLMKLAQSFTLKIAILLVVVVLVALAGLGAVAYSGFGAGGVIPCLATGVGGVAGCAAWRSRRRRPARRGGSTARK